MAKYMVTGAMVQVRGSAADGTPAVVYAYRGSVVDLDAKQAEHLTSVGLVEKVADVDNDPVANPPAGPSLDPGQLVPGKDADKAEWEAYAVRSGLSQEDAEKASQEDLVAIFADGGIEQVASEEQVEDGDARPAKNASKADWAAFAVSRGVPADEADKLTRDQLVDDPRLA